MDAIAKYALPIAGAGIAGVLAGKLTADGNGVAGAAVAVVGTSLAITLSGLAGPGALIAGAAEVTGIVIGGIATNLLRNDASDGQQHVTPSRAPEPRGTGGLTWEETQRIGGVGHGLQWDPLPVERDPNPRL